MKITKSVTIKTSLEIDSNFELIQGVIYKAWTIIGGYGWYGQKGTIEKKESFATEQKPFVKPADDLEDILDRMSSSGDFQSGKILRFDLSWAYNGESYSLSLDAESDKIPDNLKIYFVNSDSDLIDLLYLDWED